MNINCLDCERPIQDAYWEPVTLYVGGIPTYAALCETCIDDIAKTREERVQDERSLLAILADGTEVRNEVAVHSNPIATDTAEARV